jgi:hypothetical protein
LYDLGKTSGAKWVLVRKYDGKRRLGGVDGRILKWIFRKWEGGMDQIDLARIGTGDVLL